jgi:solute carrier family 25 (mitochondrial phosphate transporter), member 23/24/25/41
VFVCTTTRPLRNCAGILPYSAVDLTVYSILKEVYVTHSSQEPGIGTLLLCGAVSTTCGQLCTYPLQLVRTRLQAQGMKGRPVAFTGITDCVLKTLKHDGIFGLYKGIIPNFMKSLPAISLSYTGP